MKEGVLKTVKIFYSKNNYLFKDVMEKRHRIKSQGEKKKKEIYLVIQPKKSKPIHFSPNIHS
jgi:hypothetical protein